MKFTVTAAYISRHTVDIEAGNSNEAFTIAMDMDVSQFEQVKDSGALKIQDVVKSEANLTKEQIAFMNAYQCSVAVADREIVKTFLLEKDGPFFTNDIDEYYTSLADAYGVWKHAKDFYSKETNETIS
jgi:hypothetical protein